MIRTTKEMRVGDLVDFDNGDPLQLIVSIENDGRYYGTQIQFYGYRDSYGRSLSYWEQKATLYEDCELDEDFYVTILRGDEELVFSSIDGEGCIYSRWTRLLTP